MEVDTTMMKERLCTLITLKDDMTPDIKQFHDCTTHLITSSVIGLFLSIQEYIVFVFVFVYLFILFFILFYTILT